MFSLSCNYEKNSVSNKQNNKPEVKQSYYKYNLDVTDLHVLEENVRNGESVGKILNNYNVSFSDIDKVARLSRDLFDLRDVKSGGDYALIFQDSIFSSPIYFIYEINKVDFLVAKLQDSIQVYVDKKDLVIKEKTGSGIISSSLWYAMEESNLSAKLVNVFADEIYPWTVDFFRISTGDRFKVIYDAKYVEGEFIGIGKVHAALFDSNGEEYYALAFNEMGGFGSIKNALIDDCTLAKKVKQNGYKTWIGLTNSVISIREYNKLSEISQLITRTAYTQLRHSPILLFICSLVMGILFLVPLVAISQKESLMLMGLIMIFIQVICYLPTLKYYSMNPIYALSLSFVGILYMLFTLHSGFNYYFKKGALWKKRYYKY